MIRPGLRYHRPHTPESAVQILGDEAGNSAVLAGGTFLIPQLTRGDRTERHVVDLAGLELDEITVDAETVQIGAGVSYDAILAHPQLASTVPALVQGARGVTGGRQLTGQATFVGALCHNLPSSDAPGLAAGLGATVNIFGTNGFRHMSIEDFLIDAHHVNLRRGEFVHSIGLPRPTVTGYCKIKHCAGSWPIATATAVRDRAGTSTVTLGGVRATPLRIDLDELGHDPAEVSTFDRAVSALLDHPWEDLLAPGSYRVAIAPVAARRAIAAMEACQ